MTTSIKDTEGTEALSTTYLPSTLLQAEPHLARRGDLDVLIKKIGHSGSIEPERLAERSPQQGQETGRTC